MGSKKPSGFALVIAFLALTMPVSGRAETTRTETTLTEPARTETIRVPMIASRWQAVPGKPGGARNDVQFTRQEGFPQGLLVLKGGEMALAGLSFRNGTIEFDIKPIGQDIPGIRFRQKDADNAEEFYLRSFGECRASDDCIQYTPVIHGFMLWNAYPQYQTAAPVFEGWNHVKLVVCGRRMNAYINRWPTPSLQVGELQGETSEGAIEVRGPAVFANLTVTPDAVEGLASQAAADPTAHDRGVLRSWSLAPLAPLHYGRDPIYSEMPTDPAAWKNVAADTTGLVNLNRQFTNSPSAPSGLVWLRTSVTSTRDESKRVSLGWVGQAWVFVNGRLVTQGKNFYYPESERREPDGRISWDNGSFDLPLRKGSNEVAIAMYGSIRDKDTQKSTPYGWGLEMRFHDAAGLTLASSKASGATQKVR